MGFPHYCGDIVLTQGASESNAVRDTSLNGTLYKRVRGYSPCPMTTYSKIMLITQLSKCLDHELDTLLDFRQDGQR